MIVLKQPLAILVLAFAFNLQAQASIDPNRTTGSPEEPQNDHKQAGGKQASKSSQYILKLGVGRPVFSPELQYYEEFYGSPGLSFTMFFNQGYELFSGLSVGLGTQFSFYRVEGSQMQKPEVSAPDSFIKSDGKSSLTLLPYQLLLTASYTPWSEAWFSVDLWGGYEELYFQEIRMTATQDGTSELPANSQQLATAQQPSKKTNNKQRFINSGWNHGIAIGVAVNFRLNGLEQRSGQTLKQATSLGEIHLSPYYETILNLAGKVIIAGKESSVVTFARQTYGLTFSFRT